MYFHRSRLRSIAIMVLFLLSIGGALAEPGRAANEGAAIVASGLTNPRGFTWDQGGKLVVAEAGSGGDAEATGEAEVPPPTGPYLGGATANVVAINNQCPTVIAGALPSAQSATGEVIGAADVAQLGGNLYILVGGGGDAHGNSDQPAGIYRVAEDGASSLLVDLGAWLRDNPVAAPPEADFDPEGSWYSMIAAADGSQLFVVESNSEQVLSITTDGDVTRVADLSDTNQVPTALALAPDGGLYVGFLTSAPFPSGGASVIEIAADGTQSTVWTGLTTVTGLAVDDTGVLYASQLSTTRKRPPFLEPVTGSIVRQTGAENQEVVASGLNFPVSIEFGADGKLYVASPAIGANNATGTIIAFTPGPDAITIDESALTTPACGDGTAGATTDTQDDGGAPTEVIIRIFDFGFDSSDLTVPLGTTVMWVNTGAVQHTTVARVAGELVWDSGIMEPGATFSFTFNEAGTWEYICGLHPDMMGTITVQS